MRTEQIIKKMEQEKLVDNRKIYTYASSRSAIGSINGLVLLSINGNILYIHQANIDNSYGERLAKIYISDMKNIQGKAGMFGGKFSFNYDGKEYKFKLPAKAEKFVVFFVM